MKIHLDLPWGGVLDIFIEPHPMQPEKFYALCCVAGFAMIVWGFVSMIGLIRG